MATQQDPTSLVGMAYQYPAGSLIPVRGFTPQLGEGTFVAEGARIIGDVVMGEGCSVWFNAVVRGDVNSIHIGNHVNIQDGCTLHTLHGRSVCEVGDYASLGHNVILHGAKVGAYALIGMGAVVMDNAVVGEGAIVAAGAVVLANTIIPPYTMYAGTPAKYIKDVPPEQSLSLNKRTAHDYGMYADWFMNPEKYSEGSHE